MLHPVQRRPDNRFVVGVVLLAAGSSRRMGRPKLLLPWDNGTVLSHQILQWRDLHAAQISVVSAPDAMELGLELNRIGLPESQRIVNPAPERGMFSSIQCAAAWTGWEPALTHFVVTLGDQPHLRPDTLRALLAFGAKNPARICQPLWRSRPRHPVLMPKSAFLSLKDSNACDLRTFLESHASDRAGFDADDPGLDFDMDTPAEYERARNFFLRLRS
jgi:molybdenum cofactor cytidylyltransferase